MIDEKSLVLNLNKVSQKDIDLVGSKAGNLAKLFQKGFSVPNGFVLTTKGYYQFLKQNNLTELIKQILSKIDYTNYEMVKNYANQIQEAIKRCALPIEILNAVKDNYNKLITGSVATRSSATAEDLPTASFAGQYDTFLNLKNLSQVFQCIKDCYASFWTDRAIVYRQKNNISHINAKLAIIIQKLIPAKCAGVLFTVNPVSMNKNELIIESNYGLGESIVSGRCSPDQFLVKKEIRHKEESFKILDSQIGKKNVAIYPKSLENESGTVLIQLSDQENIQASLSEKNIMLLSQIGSQIENYLKKPQDIEWAIDENDNIYILQARPITTPITKTSEDEGFWTRGYSDDYWNDPVTPLFFDVLGDQLTKVVNMELNSIMGYGQMEKKLLKLYNGHVYFNLEVLKRKVMYEIPKFLRNEDLLNYFPDGYGSYGKITIKDLPFKIFKRIIAELRISIYDPNGAMSKTAKKYEEWNEKVFTPYCVNFDSKLKRLTEVGNLESLIGLAEELDHEMIQHFRLVRYGIPVHNIGMNLMVQYLLARFLGKEKALQFYPILISGLEHKLTETNDQIHHLALFIEKSKELKTMILEKKSKELYNYICSSESDIVKKFVIEFENFLAKYGDRGFSREIYYPRWSEAPEYVFDILKSLIMDKGVRIEKSREKESKRKVIENYVESKIRSQRFGMIKFLIFSKILNFARQYIIFRENQRFNVDKWFTRNRKVYLEIGKILTQKGVLNDASDIYFLHKKEIKNIVNETFHPNIASLIKTRKDEFFKYEYTIPPKFLYGSREFDDIFRFTKKSISFQGIPASQGIITAQIRVINNIEEISEVKAGEILVVSKTDPGWTPVFSKINGLITETGGILSHGAVVSREYGIPAVTNIPNACQLFKTGQKVTINGYNGSVIVKNK